jgi:Lon protease-like protein
MPELGLFPLPLVLLPGERIPLHIFEERYKELIGECVAGASRFGIVLEDEDGLRAVGTSAGVDEVLEVLDDGRMNVVVSGGDRFRIAIETSGRPFRTAEVAVLGDVGEQPSARTIVRALALYRKLAQLTESEVDEPAGEPEALAWQLGARVDFGAEEKQRLLEEPSPAARLDHVVALLERAVHGLELALEARTRASGNGHVSLG